jgi:hypothetical protein
VGNGCCGEREGLARRDMSRWFIACRMGPFGEGLFIYGDMWGFGIHQVLFNSFKYSFSKIFYHDGEF